MGEASTTALPSTIEIRGSALPHSAMDCTGIHALVARTIWPIKTAENWAAAAGRQARIAKYWLAGGEVSDAGKLAIIRVLG